MTWDHERVEQLLAGHALGVLDDDEAALAERALVEHVPECSRCRRALSEYEALAGDLALAAGTFSWRGGSNGPRPGRGSWSRR